MTSHIPIRDLLKTVFESILEVFVLCAAGLFLARAKITDKATQRKLNKLNISLFTPCLLFSKVAFSLSPEKIKELWIVPVGFVVVTGTSMAVAWCLGTLLRLKKSQKSFAMAGSMFMNSNSLPIALMQSLVVEVPGLKWGKDDDDEAMLGRALTYLVLYSTLGMMLRWSYGVHLLTQADDPVETSSSALETGSSPVQSDDANAHSRTPTLVTTSPSSSPSRQFRTIGDVEDPWKDVVTASGSNGHGPRGLEVENGHGRPLVKGRKMSFHSFPNSPAESIKGGLSEIEDEVDGETEEDRLLDGQRESSKAKWSRKFKKFLKGVNELFVHSHSNLLSRRAERSVFIHNTDLSHLALFSTTSFVHDHDDQHDCTATLAQLRPIREAIKSSGQCSIPLTLIVLGAYFWQEPGEGQPPVTITKPSPSETSTTEPYASSSTSTSTSTAVVSKQKRTGGWFRKSRKNVGSIALADDNEDETIVEDQRPGETRTVIVAIVSRMIITPLILLPVIALLAIYDFFPITEDPVFILTAVLIVSSPPAITLAQITQKAKGDAFERLISKTIWVSYGVFTPPLTLAYVVLGLYLSRFYYRIHDVSP
ncbi:Predicted membrane protein [Phaffia rhodozyma]|uniref:Predicted membrane protein n=1 Tax=Phaffia rhodozyma TaxID=264483 RepID=A0A0F7SG28_PHARH|nr:Predicted membrane protein [Phaffia rhodozyma]